MHCALLIDLYIDSTCIPNIKEIGTKIVDGQTSGWVYIYTYIKNLKRITVVSVLDLGLSSMLSLAMLSFRFIGSSYWKE